MAKGKRPSVAIPAPAFRFMDLPVEVRMIVYSLVCPDDLPYQQRFAPFINGYDDKAETAWRLTKREWMDKSRFPAQDQTMMALSETCRQINQESSPFVFSRYTFSFIDPVAFANDFLNRLPDHKINSLRYIMWQLPRCSREWSPVDSWGRSYRDWEMLRQLLTIHVELRSLTAFHILEINADEKPAINRARMVRCLSESVFRGFTQHRGNRVLTDSEKVSWLTFVNNTP